MRARPTLTALLCALVLLTPHASGRQAQGLAGPPKAAGTFREPDLVELEKLDRTFKLDVRYATANNFAGRAACPRAEGMPETGAH
jgi:zinc D-Ala-D-Ala dipeptidase